MNVAERNSRGSNRRTAIIVGVLYIVGTVSGMLSLIFTSLFSMSQTTSQKFTQILTKLS